MTTTTVDAEDVQELADEDISVLPVGWQGIIGYEDQITGDGRVIDDGALVWETPFPLRFVTEDVGAHDGAVSVGTALRAERREGGAIWATGTFDLGGEHGREAARLVADEVQNGVSMDLDEVEFEVRDENNEKPDPEEEGDEGDLLDMLFGGPDGIMATTSGRIRAATLVAIPAFKDATISAVYDMEEITGEKPEEANEDSESITQGDTNEAEDGLASDSVVAGAFPFEPPSEWFSDPHLTSPTPLHVDPSGRVYGHLATWGVCHTAQPGGPGTCVTAPSSDSGYAAFHTGTLRTKSGEVISVGHLTMNTEHALPTLAASQTRAHYDNSGTAVADVRAGEDEHGIWVAGALRPSVTREQVRALRASPLSGDWRRIDGSLELVAALAVNVPGFPIPRPAGLVASGELTALVASGMIAPRKVRRRTESGEVLSDSDLRYLKALADRERTRERTALALRVQRARVKAMAAKRRSTKDEIDSDAV